MIQIENRRVITIRRRPEDTINGFGSNVGVGVGVAMGVIVGVANVAIRESVVATKRKQRNKWLRCISNGLHVYVLHVQLPSEQRMKAMYPMPDQTSVGLIVAEHVTTTEGRRH